MNNTIQITKASIFPCSTMPLLFPPICKYSSFISEKFWVLMAGCPVKTGSGDRYNISSAPFFRTSPTRGLLFFMSGFAKDGSLFGLRRYSLLSIFFQQRAGINE
ncbi:hypothetical protein QN415_02820, partial [Pseudomonas sp. 5S4]|uniref:hypothetical protein n=1 Tax=Pseudomonas sp. 5S4 TaxID=3048596 RepID=UPI002B229E50